MKKFTKAFLCAFLAAVLLCGAVLPSFAGSDDFTDIPKKYWGRKAITWATDEGLMSGIGGGKFDPEGTLTRAMFVSILYRLTSNLGKDVSLQGTKQFKDIKQGGKAWYVTPVLWGAEAGIIEGSGGYFRPEDPVTREQMGLIIYRYIVEYLGLDIFGYQSKTSYRDTIKISAWARPAMKQIAKMDLMLGDADRYFHPQNTASRAEAASVFQRLVEFLTEYEAEHPDGAIKVMTYNVYYVDSDTNRLQALADSVIAENPDLLGVQEATDGWLTYLDSALKDGFARIGFGRDTTPEGGEHGESAAIYYKTSLFDLIEQKTLWISDTPDVLSKYEASACNRVMTYAILERKSDGFRFLYVNTHLDYKLDAAVWQVGKMFELIDGIGFDGLTMVTGDFNIDMLTNLKEYEAVMSYGYYNSYDIAKRREQQTTWEDQILDYCLFNSQTDVDVVRYEVKSENNNSDHHPVVVTFVPVVTEN